MASERGVPVDLYIYDLTNGLAAVLSPAILDEQPLVIGAELDSDIGVGRQVEGVWHTAIVVYDREYFYGGGGITSCDPGGTQLGAPHQVERLGETFVPRQLFVDYIQGLASTTYTGAEYRLLEHNCNHFSDEVAQFLCGARVPKHILQQPAQLPPPLRLALSALLDNMLPAQTGTTAPQMAWDGGVRGARGARADSPEFLTLNSQIEQARQCRHAAAALMFRLYLAIRMGAERICRTVRGAPLAPTSPAPRAASPTAHAAHRENPETTVEGAELEQRRSTLAEKLARKERRAEKKRKNKHNATRPVPEEMADGVEVEVPVASQAAGGAGPGPSSSSARDDLDERREEELRRRAQDPPIVYRDIDGAAEFEKLSKALEGAELSGEERTSLDELQQYLVQGEGSWVLGDDFLAFIGRILTDERLECARVAALRCMAACALRDDVSLLLHQDRRHHALLTHAHRIDTLPTPEQEALALFMCNLFENLSSSEWLLYISEWQAPQGQMLSNIRCTTKVCVHCALAEGGGELRELGTALMHNVATKEVKTVVFDEVCVELGMALLQLLAWAPCEEHMWRALRSLARLAQHSADIAQLVQMVGPDPAAFRGTSSRIDEQIDLIAQRLK